MKTFLIAQTDLMQSAGSDVTFSRVCSSARRCIMPPRGGPTMPWIAAFSVLLLLVGALGPAWIGKVLRGRRAVDLPRRCKPLEGHSLEMYYRLVTSFPNALVLHQVGSGLVLRDKPRPLLQAFGDVVVDFVVVTRNFEVIALVELAAPLKNGASPLHEGHAFMLAQVGVPLVRYGYVPNCEQLKADIFDALPRNS